VRERELEGDDHRDGERHELEEGQLASDDSAEQREHRHEANGKRTKGRDRVELSPEADRRVARELPADRPVVELPDAAVGDEEREQRRGETHRAQPSQDPGPRRPSGRAEDERP